MLTAPVTRSVLAPPRLQLLALKLPPPGGTLLALQLTVPLGALAVKLPAPGGALLALQLRVALGELAEVGVLSLSFFFNDTATPEISALSLHDALPILACLRALTTKLPALLRWVPSPL